MIRTILLSSSSSSSSSTSSTSTAARHSTCSSSSSFTSDLALFPDCHSSRPSSVTYQDFDFKRLHNPNPSSSISKKDHVKKPNKYFSFSRFSSDFHPKTRDLDNNASASNSSVKRMSVTAREVIRKYFKKVKPIYEKLSQKQQQHREASATTTSVLSLLTKTERSNKQTDKRGRKDSVSVTALSHSFSGNLRYPRRRRIYVSSCPSSMRSSPNHSGVLSQRGAGMYCGDASTMEELQSAIQGAIAHCKNSLIQTNKTMI